MAMTSADRERLEADAEMSAAVERMGWDKCLRISCPAMIDRAKNRDGFCQFHRPKRVLS